MLKESLKETKELKLEYNRRCNSMNANDVEIYTDAIAAILCATNIFTFAISIACAAKYNYDSKRNEGGEPTLGVGLYRSLKQRLLKRCKKS